MFTPPAVFEHPHSECIISHADVDPAIHFPYAPPKSGDSLLPPPSLPPTWKSAVSLSSSPLDRAYRGERRRRVRTGDGDSDGEGVIGAAAAVARPGLPGGRQGVVLRSPDTG